MELSRCTALPKNTYSVSINIVGRASAEVTTLYDYLRKACRFSLISCPQCFLKRTLGWKVFPRVCQDCMRYCTAVWNVGRSVSLLVPVVLGRRAWGFCL